MLRISQTTRRKSVPIRRIKFARGFDMTAGELRKRPFFDLFRSGENSEKEPAALVKGGLA